MEVVELPIGKIKPSGTQDGQRTKDIKSLSESIAAIGVLQPIVVVKKGRSYEIVAGERRHAAAKLAKLTTVPSCVIAADADKAQVIRVTENLQRQSLTPLQEAAAIEKLTDLGRNVKEVAADLGTSASFVARRQRLTALTPKWRKFLAAAKVPWPVASMELIAKYEPSYQDQLFERFAEEYDIPTPGDIASFISQDKRLLRMVPWDVKDEGLMPDAGSCINCQKRSAQQPLLFHDDDEAEKKIQKEDTCLDPACWRKKGELFLEIRIEDLQRQYKNLQLITNDHWYDGTHKKVMKPYKYELCAKSDKGVVPAVHVDGAQIGRLAWIKRWSASGDQSGTEKKKASELSPKEREKARLQRLTDRRNKHVVVELLKLFDHRKPVEPEGLLKLYEPVQVRVLLDLGEVFGVTGQPYFSGWKEYRRCQRQSVTEVIERYWKSLRNSLRSSLQNVRLITEATEIMPYLKPLAVDIFGLDWKKLHADAAEALPDRRAMQKLPQKKSKKKK